MDNFTLISFIEEPKPPKYRYAPLQNRLYNQNAHVIQLTFLGAPSLNEKIRTRKENIQKIVVIKKVEKILIQNLQ